MVRAADKVAVGKHGVLWLLMKNDLWITSWKGSWMFFRDDEWRLYAPLPPDPPAPAYAFQPKKY